MSGPSGGYGFEEKGRYRKRVWPAIESGLTHIPRDQRKVVVLDSSDAHEAFFLVERGYRQDNICLVNRNPATVAWATTRLRGHGITKIKRKGAQLSTALRELASEGWVPDAINMDFCSSLGIPLENELCELRDGIPDPCVVAFTILRGREDSGLRFWRNSMLRRGVPPDDAADFGRIRSVVLTLGGAIGDYQALCSQHLRLRECDQYLSSSGQTMMWFVADACSHRSGVTNEHHRRWLAKASRASKASVQSLSVPVCMCIGGMASNSTVLPSWAGTPEKWIDWLGEQDMPMPSILFRFRLDGMPQRLDAALGIDIEARADAMVEDSKMAAWLDRERRRFTNLDKTVDDCETGGI